MTSAPMLADYDVRLALPTADADATTFDRLHAAGITTEGYGAGRVIAVQRISATTDIDALVEARERIRSAAGLDPMWIVAVHPTRGPDPRSCVRPIDSAPARDDSTGARARPRSVRPSDGPGHADAPAEEVP